MRRRTHSSTSRDNSMAIHRIWQTFVLLIRFLPQFALRGLSTIVHTSNDLSAPSLPWPIHNAIALIQSLFRTPCIRCRVQKVDVRTERFCGKLEDRVLVFCEGRHWHQVANKLLLSIEVACTAEAYSTSINDFADKHTNSHIYTNTHTNWAELWTISSLYVINQIFMPNGCYNTQRWP